MKFLKIIISFLCCIFFLSAQELTVSQNKSTISNKNIRVSAEVLDEEIKFKVEQFKKPDVVKMNNDSKESSSFEFQVEKKDITKILNLIKSKKSNTIHIDLLGGEYKSKLFLRVSLTEGGDLFFAVVTDKKVIMDYNIIHNDLTITSKILEWCSK